MCSVFGDWFADFLRSVCGFFAPGLRIFCARFADFLRSVCGFFALSLRIFCARFATCMDIDISMHGPPSLDLSCIIYKIEICHACHAYIRIEHCCMHGCE